MKDKAHEKEKQRTLTPAEQKRLERFTQICNDLEQQGYSRKDLTVGIVRANIFALVLMVPLFIIGTFLYIRIHPEKPFPLVEFRSPLFWILIIVLTVVHELIHGITWSFSAKNGFKDIEFGFMKEYLTPYCTCTVPLPKGGYIIGTLMPFIALGILPAAAGIILGNSLALIVGLFMIIAAGGDILIVLTLLKHGNSGSGPLIYDHPTQAGCVIFEQTGINSTSTADTR